MPGRWIRVITLPGVTLNSYPRPVYPRPVLHGRLTAEAGQRLTVVGSGRASQAIETLAVATTGRSTANVKCRQVRRARVARTALRRWQWPLGQVLAAPVDAKPPQGDDVHGDDHERPERVGGNEEHLAYGVESHQGHREPAGQLVARQNPAGR